MIMLRKARLIDPVSKLDDIRDVIISDKKIMKIGEELEFVAPLMARAKGEKLNIIDCKGLIVAPAFIDTNINLIKKEIKEESLKGFWKEALKEGFTTLCLTVNEDNIVDNEEDILNLMKTSNKIKANIKTFASIIKKEKNDELVDMRLLRDAGALAFVIDDKIINDENLLKEAMNTARKLKMPISINIKINEKNCLKKLLCCIRDSGVSVIIQNIKDKVDIEILREARKKNIKISVSINLYDFSFNELILENKKLILDSIREGLIEIISGNYSLLDKSDEKNVFMAPCFSLGVMNIVDAGIISMSDFIAMFTSNVARFYGLDTGFIREDKIADLVVFDPDKKWSYNNEFTNTEKNLLKNKELRGKVVLTIASGLIEYRDI